MQSNRKLAILLVLVTAAIFVWVPKSKKTQGVSSTTSLVTFDQAIPVDRKVPRRRTEFVDWGKDPFAWLKREEEAGEISDLALSCIIWNDEGSRAVIGKSIVREGDKIGDKTVKRIEQNRVILNDGTKDYVLELQE